MSTGFPRGRPKKGEVRPPKEPGKGQGWRKGLLKYTGEELDAKMEEYFAHCNEMKRKPTQAGLCLHLGISDDTFYAWLSDEKGNYSEVSGTLKKALQRIQDDLEQRTDGMSVFRLKQGKYGGYTDKQVDESGGKLQIEILFGDKKNGK